MKADHDQLHGSVEHPVDVLDVAASLDERWLATLREAIAGAAAQEAARARAWLEELHAIDEASRRLRELAFLARLALLGHGDAPTAFRGGLSGLAGEAHSNGHLDPEHHHQHEHTEHAGARLWDLAPLIDALTGVTSMLDPAEGEPAAGRLLSILEDLGHRLVSLGRAVASHGRLSGARTLTPFDVGCPCSEIQRLFTDWIKDNPISGLAHATHEARNNAALAEASPSQARTGDRLVLTARPDHRFSERQPAGVEVVFYPGLSAKILRWSGEAIEVEVPGHARSGPVRFGKQLDAAEVERLIQWRAGWTAAYPCDFPRTLLGLRPLQTLAWPALLKDSRLPSVQIRRPPQISAFQVLDAAGRDVSKHPAEAGESITVQWRLAGDDLQEHPVELFVDGRRVFQRHADGHPPCDRPLVPLWMPGAFDFVALTLDEDAPRPTIELQVGQLRRQVELRPLLHLEVSPQPIRVRPGQRGALVVRSSSPAPEEVRVSVRSERGVLQFIRARGGDPETYTLAPGERWAVFTFRHVGDHGPERGTAPETPDDTIHVSYEREGLSVHSARRVEVWVERPHGRWEEPLEDALGLVAVHAVLTHTGKVLYFSFAGGSLEPTFADLNRGLSQLFDPATRTASPEMEVGRNLFCAAQCTLPDGRVFAPGGQNPGGAAPERGEAWRWIGDIFSGAMADIHTFDPPSETWSRHTNMNEGRYYPTAVTLADGRAFVAGGLSDLIEYVAFGGAAQNDQFEVFDGSRVVERGKFRSSDQYPILQVLPSTSLLFVHVKNATYLFDLATRRFLQMRAEFFGELGATEDLKILMPPEVGKQTYPAQTGCVMLPLEPGVPVRLLIVGGSSSGSPGGDTPALQRAFIFELNAESPRSSMWRPTRGNPNYARVLTDAVLLPDGQVLVLNGAQRGHANDPSEPLFTPELFDPSTETFAALAPSHPSHPRMYHSTAILLPDARVAIGGHTALGNVAGLPGSMDDHSIEVFNPPYLFRGPRPRLEGAPLEIAYGATFHIDAWAAEVARVTLVRPGAVTHSVDMGQRLLVLEILDRRDGRITVRAPADGTLAAPGFWMLFLISPDGVPSRGHFLRLS